MAPPRQTPGVLIFEYETRAREEQTQGYTARSIVIVSGYGMDATAPPPPPTLALL